MRNKYIQKKNAGGFTLLEVLVALTIFSVAAASLIFSDGQAVRQIAHVQNKVMSSWLAEKELNQLYAKNTWLEKGIHGKSESFDNRPWYVQTEVTEWKHPSIHQVNIHIYSGEEPKKDQKIYQLTGFIRKKKQAFDD